MTDLRRMTPALAGAARIKQRPMVAPMTNETPSAQSDDRISTIAVGLVWAGALFNLLLCFVDSQVARMSAGPVMAAEALILGAALSVPFARKDRSPGRMDVLLIVLLANWLLLSIIRQSVEPKMFRDVAIIPIFVLLGMANRGLAVHRRIFWLLMVVAVVALWEAISVKSFVSVFQIADYFGHTRGSNNADWWIDSGLYLSAVRPEARFLFPALPMHRLSSVFLEPVSLGNFVMISTIWLIGFWQRIPPRMRIAGSIAVLFLLVGSDSRMASVTCLALLLAAPFRRSIPAIAPLLTAPLVIAAMFIAVAAFGLTSGLDDFGGRIAYSVDVFRAFDLMHYLGWSLSLVKDAEDAGFAYIIMSQSLLVAVVIWASLFARPPAGPTGRYVHFGVALYVALNLTVSWSLFSIKTAALLWFLLGLASRNDEDDPGQAVNSST